MFARLYCYVQDLAYGITHAGFVHVMDHTKFSSVKQVAVPMLKFLEQYECENDAKTALWNEGKEIGKIGCTTVYVWHKKVWITNCGELMYLRNWKQFYKYIQCEHYQEYVKDIKAIRRKAIKLGVKI